MLKNEIFTSVILTNGSKCDIIEMKTGHVMKASMKMMKAIVEKNEHAEYGIIPFIACEVMRIDGREIDMNYLENMEAEDYYKNILPVIDASVKKINL